jgi:hypothetical protein
VGKSKPLLRDLENDYVLGANKYQRRLWKHCKCLWFVQTNQSKLKKKQLVETDEGTPEVVCVQMKKTEMIKEGLCFCCIEKGHKASECQKMKKEDEETAERDTMHM